MVGVRLSGINISRDAKSLAAELLDGAPASDRNELTRLLRASAQSDGNSHLGASEVATIKSLYEGSGRDLAASLAQIESAISARVASRDLNGIKAYFTGTTADVNKILIDELRATIAQANGKPVEFHAMIFAFVDPEVGAAMEELARAHSNVTFRLVADFDQLSETGGRQPPRLAKLELPNLRVKFKKDSPYTWSDTLGRPVYNHSSTKGLNHHKGFVALIDGRPVKLVTGSYNWSKTADDKNYENLFVIDNSVPANRPLINSYQAEFAAFYNDRDTLSFGQAKRWKVELFNILKREHGVAEAPLPPEGAAEAPYVARPPANVFDVNSLSDENYDRLRTIFGDSRILRSVISQYSTYGRFASLSDLIERVPAIARLSTTRLRAVTETLEFGEGRVPINSAGADEMMRALKISRPLALAIIAKRHEVGDFESAGELRALPGMTSAIFERIQPRLNLMIARSYFSSRPYSAANASFGYAVENATRTYRLMGSDGVVSDREASLAAGVIDLLRRTAPGDRVTIGMYGLSMTTAEYQEILATARRGVTVRVILEDDANEAAIAALRTARDGGLPIEIRVQKARTMHEKIGVSKDDYFYGTANMSGSSSSKHSEDRFVVKNDPETALAILAELDRVWEKSRDV